MAVSSVFINYSGPSLFPEDAFRQWIHALVRAGIFVAVALFFLTPAFQTSDDTESQLALSGLSLSPEPNGHLRYTHAVFGQLLAILYRLNNCFPWYAMYLYSAHLVGIAAAWLALQRIGGGPWRGGVFWLLLLFVELPFLQHLQFTTAAFILAQGALLLLRTAEQAPDRRLADLVLPLLLFSVAAMIRWEAALLSAIVSLPIFYAERPELWRRRILLALVMLSLPVLLRLQPWNDRRWEDYQRREATGVRIAMLDYQDQRFAWTRENAERFAAAGWSENDYRLYRKWFMADSSVFGEGALRRLNAATESAEGTSLRSRLGRAFDVFRLMPPHLERSFLLILLLVPAVPAIDKRRRTYFFSLLLTLAAAMALSGWYHLPERVSFPLFAWPVLAGLWLTPPLQVFGGCYRVVVTLAAVWCAFFGVREARNSSRETQTQYVRWRASLERLDPKPDQLYLTSGEHLRHVALPFKRACDPLLQRFKTLDTGHFSDQPVWYRQLEAFGIKNPHAEIVQRPNFLLLLPLKDKVLRSEYLVFLQEHYGYTAQLVPVWEDGETGMGAWRVELIKS